MSGLTLDHLVIAVRDLDAASANYQRLLRREPSWRGKHPTYGTANVLFRLDNCYVELISTAGGASESSWGQALQQYLHVRGEGLYAIALGTDDIDTTVASARASGVHVLDAAPGDGVDLDTGARREWRNARIDPESTRGVPAFFIQHESPPDALPAREALADGSSAVAVDHTVIASPDLDAALGVWRDALGLDLRRTVDWAGGERRLCFFRLGDSILELAGPGTARPTPHERTQRHDESPGGTSDQRPATSDQLWGVSYRVPNLTSTVARLRGAGVAISDVRTGNAPNTLVADLKPGFSHDVRTLFIQKDVP